MSAIEHKKAQLKLFRKRVAQHFEDLAHAQKCTPKEAKRAPNVAFAFYFLAIFSMILFGFLWAKHGFYSLSLCFGVSIFFGSGSALHDGMHREITPTLNYWLPLIFGWLHCNPYTWKLQHMKSHHAHTNQKADVDIWHFPPLFRVSPLSPKIPLARIKFILFLIFGMPLVSLGPSIVRTLFCVWRYNKFNSHQPEFIPSSQEFVTSVIHFFLLIAMFSFGFLKHGFVSTILIYQAHGFIYFWISQVSHVNENSELTLDAMNNFDLASRHSSHGDYCVHSMFWTVLSIGLNMQAIHHLCPEVHWMHYSNLYAILEEIEGRKVTNSYWKSAYECCMFIWKIN